MTDTPETDEAERESIEAYIETYGEDAIFPCDGYDLARNLERERDEARERADAMFAKYADTIDEAWREQDEWKEMYIEANRERDEWKAKYVQQNKDLGCEMMDPNGTIWDYAKNLQKECEKLKSALKVIHTWASFRNGSELVPEHVANLTAKALNLTKQTK